MTATTAEPLVAVAKVLGGFVLGGLIVVFLPPLAFAMALVLGAVLLWSRLRGEDVAPLTWLATGFLVAVGGYALAAIGYALI